jgi:hypothetical protein
VQKAPDYDRIRHTLRLAQDPLNSDDLWVQKYLELGDKALKFQHAAVSMQHSAPKRSA